MRLKLYRGWWYVVWREAGKTQRRALRTQNRDAAQRALDDYKRGLARPSDNVASIYKAYLTDKGTERSRWAWKRLEGHFGAMRPDQVDRASCRAYIKARQAQDIGDGTILTELTYLRAALRWHDKNTPATIEMPAKPPPMDRHLTREEYDRLLAVAVTPHIKLFIVLALATAGRMTAILQLKWERVDFERDLIKLGDGTKQRKGRATVPMTARAKVALVEAHEMRTCDHVIEYGGGPVKKVRKALARAAADAGLADVTPHCFRRTAAVWMAEADVSMPKIAQFLGHGDSRTTEKHYARFSPSYLKGAVTALE